MALRVVWLLIVIALPFASAASSFEADDVLPVNSLYRNSWVVGPAVDFVLALNAGDVVDASLAWSDPNAFLFVGIWGESAAPCEPGLGCFLKAAPDCSATSGPPLESTQTVRTVAPYSEEYRVHVAAKAAVVDVPFHVSIRVNGEAAVVGEIRDAFYLNPSSAACSLPH